MAEAAERVVKGDRAGLLARVAQEGLEVGSTYTGPKVLPSSPEDQWALLKPYVGRPISAIPKGLVLLFTVPTGATVMSAQLVARILQLPAAVRQAAVFSSDNTFI